MEIGYCIDDEAASENASIVLRIRLFEIQGSQCVFLEDHRRLSLGEVRRVLTKEDSKIFDFLSLKSKISFPFAFVNSIDSIDVLKCVAPTGRLFFRGEKILCDFLGSADFIYSLLPGEDGGCKVEAKLKWGKLEIFFSDCDFFCLGDSSWFIKGIILKKVDGSVHRKWIEKIVRRNGMFSLDRESMLEFLEKYSSGDLLGFPKVSLDRELKDLRREDQKEVLPFLVLRDKHGVFADLWMDYGSSEKKPMHELTLSPKDSERLWEQDLLETDYIKKEVGSSHYYCPTDKVNDSLKFLLELGWTVIDQGGKQVFLSENPKLSVREKGVFLEVKGRISCNSREVSLSEIFHPLKNRENFFSFDEGKVCLLPEEWKKEEFLDLSELEVLDGSIRIRKCHALSFSRILDNGKEIEADSSIREMCSNLLSFRGIKKCSPGEKFLGVLRPYQKEGLGWLLFLKEHGFHGILADDMGLGKTIQALAFLSLLKLKDPILLIVPKTLIFNWKREIETFLPSYSLYLHRGSSRLKDPEKWKEYDLILTSYSILRADEIFFRRMHFQSIILDEAQVIKNPESCISQTVCRLSADFRLCITGTPIENRLMDLWAQFRFLMPELLGERKDFHAEATSLCEDSRFLQGVKKKIRPFLLRRYKNEVAKDLPLKIEQKVFVEMSEAQRKIYDKFLFRLKNGLLKKIKEEGSHKYRMEVFESILRLRQICCHPLLLDSLLESDDERESGKFDMLFMDLESLIEEKNKVLVYSQFTSMLNLIGNRIERRGYSRKMVRLDGKTSEREGVVRRFQEDKDTLIFLISLKAGGVGLNLTAADYVFLYEPWWNESVENQAIDRVHRIGRKKTVIVKRYIMKESIEEKMMFLKESKHRLIGDVIGEGTDLCNLSLEDLSFLIE